MSSVASGIFDSSLDWNLIFTGAAIGAVLIDHGTIEPDGSMALTFKDGTTISA